jgi:stage V sporulation protein AC
MDKKDQKEYGAYIKKITPTHDLGKQMLHAFFCGGVICAIGQSIINLAVEQGVEKDMAGSICSLTLIFISVLLTGFGVFPSIVKWGGAGALVPITGFANSVAAPAIEYKAQGWVFGVGCKIFTIAGPVILYGLFSSWCLGLVYWLGKVIG